VLADVLVEPGERRRYLYDFGDDWEYDIRLEKVLPPEFDPAAFDPASVNARLHGSV
jgi:hypothetical protein